MSMNAAFMKYQDLSVRPMCYMLHMLSTERLHVSPLLLSIQTVTLDSAGVFYFFALAELSEWVLGLQ